ncbi:arsenate reductase family protein [Myroides sp. LJL119]
MRILYYLSTCDTCKRIMKDLPDLDTFELREIKKQPISANELDQMYKLSNSYQALFNKRAQLYKSRNLKNANLQEQDFKDLLLEHYTFLSRPVFIIDNEIFIGNSSKVIQQVKQKITY